jgi:ubiquinone/menaquinone biosynthesis C-methylase UbiE
MAMGCYSVIAGEYYDASLHPTCANFSELSHRYIEAQLYKQSRKALAVLEVGAGKSVVTAFKDKNAISFSRLTLLDSSQEMLARSQADSDSIEFVVADAQSTGLPEKAYDLIVSSLGDPYNTEAFWLEVYRLLRPGGMCLFTCPAAEWAFVFRNSDRLTEAEFVLSDGETVFVPSFVSTFEEQVRVIEHCGLCVESSDTFSVSDLTGSVSPKLLVSSGGRDPIVLRGFQIRKSC